MVILAQYQSFYFTIENIQKVELIKPRFKLDQYLLSRISRYLDRYIIHTSLLQNDTLELDFDYFVQLFEEYYLSDDPSDLGNFINGRLDFGDMEENSSEEEPENEPDPGLLDHRIDSSTSIHSMDDDLRLDDYEYKKSKKKNVEKSDSVIKLHDSPVKKVCHSLDCCRLF